MWSMGGRHSEGATVGAMSLTAVEYAGDNSSCTGCTYEVACNYDPEALFLDIAQCDFGTCGGCTDITACNYNPTVGFDDGSCDWCECLEEVFNVGDQLEEPYSLYIESYPAVGGVDDLPILCEYGECHNHIVQSAETRTTHCWLVPLRGSHNSELAGITANGANPILFRFIPGNRG